MHHPPQEQIDDFGVWVLELDYGIITVDGVATAFVGHDEPGDATCFMEGGFELVKLLRTIRKAAALKYRPVFIYFDLKPWELRVEIGSTGTPVFVPPDRDTQLDAGFRAVTVAFDRNFIKLDERTETLPTIAELAGTAVVFTNMLPNPSLLGCHSDNCITRELVEEAIQTGVGVERNPLDPSMSSESCGSGGCHGLRLDQYQADWTFEYGVPPNPLVVDASTQPPSRVDVRTGSEWSCRNGDVSHDEVVAEQGTYKFPFKTVGRAVARAEGRMANGVMDERRAGLGWTVLIRPAEYHESLHINVPLRLEKDNGSPGKVVIVGQAGRMVRSLAIAFQPKDDGKDDDTGLLVEIKCANGRILARYRQSRRKGYSIGLSQIEQLQIFGPVFEVDLRNARITIDIDPNGSDTWRFGWELHGTWSDTAPFVDRQEGVDLDEERTHFERALQV